MANLNQYFESFVEIQFCQFLNGQNEASFIREKVKKVVIACWKCMCYSWAITGTLRSIRIQNSCKLECAHSFPPVVGFVCTLPVYLAVHPIQGDSYSPTVIFSIHIWVSQVHMNKIYLFSQSKM